MSSKSTAVMRLAFIAQLKVDGNLSSTSAAIGGTLPEKAAARQHEFRGKTRLKNS
jgi:hypothetical protein